MNEKLILMHAFSNAIEAKAVGLALKDVLIEMHPDKKEDFLKHYKKHLSKLVPGFYEESGLDVPQELLEAIQNQQGDQ